MSENQPHKARQLMAQARPLLPLLAVALALLALWLAWSGWQQVQDESRRGALQQARDGAAQATARSLNGELERLTERLAAEPVQRALAEGDLEAASAELAGDWPNLEEVAVYGPSLESVYAGLGESGFGRAAVLEAALVEDRPVAWVIREDDAPRVALAAPARDGDALLGAAFARLPLARATLATEQAPIDESSMYLALRQGGVTLLERGNTDYVEAAERMSTPVAGTGLRVVAAAPAAPAAPFGLRGLAPFIAALGLLLLAYLCWRVLPKLARVEVVGEEDAPTLSQAMAEAPAGEAAPAPVVAEARAAAVKIDRGIFRAYDIRGVVGQSLDTGVAELVGQAIGSLMREQDLADIVVGRDGRLSGPDMVAGLDEGLRKAGRNVTDTQQPVRRW